jgi:hypothetical protein
LSKVVWGLEILNNDYTKWHENLSDTMTVEEISKKAMEDKKIKW